MRKKQIAIDGKKLRGMSPSVKSAEKGLYMLNAWVAENEICIGQIKVEDKSNETTVTPQMIWSLDITDAIVSIDAIGAQRYIASLIVARGGHYFLSLKENQKNPLREAQDAFRLHAPSGKWSCEERGHGGREVRICKILPVAVLEAVAAYQPWPHLKTIVKIERIRDKGGQRVREEAFYISDEDFPKAKYYALLARGHWGVENKLHHVLNVTFREDGSRVRKGYAPQNLSALRKMALALIKQMDDKRSLIQRRKKCLRNMSYLCKVVNIC
ncbi:MAG: ISAs1 family transposase [Clostridium sp.]|nr:ISAs1 family transposase [Clostridium sp.]